MHKIELLEKSIYFGKISMPKGYEIDNESLFIDITGSEVYNIKYPVSRIWGQLNTYLIENLYLKFKLRIVNVNTWGNILYPNKDLELIAQSQDYSNDFILLYGVKIEPQSTYVKIIYDNKIETYPIRENEFIMFPSNFIYSFTKNKTNKINYVQTINYELV